MTFLARKIGLNTSGATKLVSDNQTVKQGDEQKRRVDVVFTNLSFLHRYVDVTLRSGFRDEFMLPIDQITAKRVMKPIEIAEIEKKQKYAQAEKNVSLDIFAVTHLAVLGRDALK